MFGLEAWRLKGTRLGREKTLGRSLNKVGPKRARVEVGGFKPVGPKVLKKTLVTLCNFALQGFSRRASLNRTWAGTKNFFGDLSMHGPGKLCPGFVPPLKTKFRSF